MDAIGEQEAAKLYPKDPVPRQDSTSPTPSATETTALALPDIHDTVAEPNAPGAASEPRPQGDGELPQGPEHAVSPAPAGSPLAPAGSPLAAAADAAEDHEVSDEPLQAEPCPGTAEDVDDKPRESSAVGSPAPEVTVVVTVYNMPDKPASQPVQLRIARQAAVVPAHPDDAALEDGSGVAVSRSSEEGSAAEPAPSAAAKGTSTGQQKVSLVLLLAPIMEPMGALLIGDVLQLTVMVYLGFTTRLCKQLNRDDDQHCCHCSNQAQLIEANQCKHTARDPQAHFPHVRPSVCSPLSVGCSWCCMTQWHLLVQAAQLWQCC